MLAYLRANDAEMAVFCPVPEGFGAAWALAAFFRLEKDPLFLRRHSLSAPRSSQTVARVEYTHAAGEKLLEKG